MLFLDSLCNYRTTEPIWFRFFRGSFAITLTVIIIYYSIIQFEKIGTEASTNIRLLQHYFHSQLDINMCTNKIDGLSCQSCQLDLLFDFTDLFDSGCNPYFNHSYVSIPDNTLSLSLDSYNIYEHGSDFAKINITRFSKTYSEEVGSYIILNQYDYLFPLGQSYVMSFKPIIINNNRNDYEIDNEYILELNPQLEQLPEKSGQLNSDEPLVEFIQLSDPRIEETKKFGLADFISNVGGFYSAIAGIFYLLFGMQKHEPWGWVQKYFFSYMPCQCRQSIKRSFARKYVSSAGIPLVEKVNKRPEGSSLEERVQMLETLLRDYYLDDYYLEKVKNVRIKHKKLLKKYNEIDRQYNENAELDDSL
ncbi:hypothetical protein C1645_791530, partial [Glomus cerebriforme]